MRGCKLNVGAIRVPVHEVRRRLGGEATPLQDLFDSVDEAAWWFITMERSCQAQLMAEAAGKPVLIDPDTASLTYSQIGSHYVGWFSFQPVYDMIVRQEPDLLD